MTGSSSSSAPARMLRRAVAVAGVLGLASKTSGVAAAPGAIMALDLGEGHTIVTILCDYGTRYQSKLFNAKFLREKELSVPSWLGPTARHMPDVFE